MEEVKAADTKKKVKEGLNTVVPSLTADQLVIQYTLPTYSELPLDQAIMFGLYGVWAEGPPLGSISHRFYRDRTTKPVIVDIAEQSFALHVANYFREAIANKLEDAFLKRLMRAGKQGRVKFFGVKVYSIADLEADGDGDDLADIPSRDLHDGRRFDYESNSIEYDFAAISPLMESKIIQTNDSEIAMRAAKLFRWEYVSVEQASFATWLKQDDKTHTSKARINVSKRLKDRAILTIWLVELMREHPDEPISKDNAKQLAENEELLDVGTRPFDSAWIEAVEKSGSDAWGEPGTRKPVSWFDEETHKRKSPH